LLILRYSQRSNECNPILLVLQKKKMDPISEENNAEQPPRSCCSFLFGRKSVPEGSTRQQQQPPQPAPAASLQTKTAAATATTTTTTTTTREPLSEVKRSTRPGMARRREESVYFSARESLNSTDLLALEEFEDAVVDLFCGGNESVYLLALAAEDNEGEKEEDGGNNLAYTPATVPEPKHKRESVIFDDPATLLAETETETDILQELKEPRIKVELSGYPGNLTNDELEACQQFRSELKERSAGKNDGKIYEEIVRAYRQVETEPYALCRFLRARKFQVSEVFVMMDECVEDWRKARDHNFYPDAVEAIGAPINVFLTQFPTVSYGCAKNGAPLSYLRTEGLSVEGMECLTDLERLPKFAWNQSYYGIPNDVAKAQRKTSDLVRCEMLQIVDLECLNSSTLNARTLETLKSVIAVNKSFPETLNSMVILNAPRFFTFFWRVIKTMLDPRTASKVTMFSNKQQGHQWLAERIDSSELLSDYGGTGPSFADVQTESAGTGAKRQVVKLFAGSAKETLDVSLAQDENVELTVYTRSKLGGDFSLSKGKVVIGSVHVKPPNNGTTDGAYVVRLFPDETIQGPAKFSISCKAKTGQDYFVVAGSVK